jgi:hypothetical protein
LKDISIYRANGWSVQMQINYTAYVTTQFPFSFGGRTTWHNVEGEVRIFEDTSTSEVTCTDIRVLCVQPPVPSITPDEMAEIKENLEVAGLHEYYNPPITPEPDF